MEDFYLVHIDDESEFLEVFKSQIEDQTQLNLVQFTCPSEALNFIELKAKKIAMIFSDYRMPEFNGIEFRQKMLEIDGDIPYVIMTGFWDKKLAQKAMEYKVSSFIDKNIDRKEIISLLDKFAAPRIEVLNDDLEMIQGFIEESFPMLDELETILLELEDDPQNDSHLQVYFRILHTIKGTSSCVGLERMGKFAHVYEDFISNIRSGSISVNSETVNLLFKGMDRLKTMFQYIADNGDDNCETEDIVALLKNFGQGKGPSETEDQPRESTSSQTQEKKTEASSHVKEDDKAVVSMDLLDQFLADSGELTVLRSALLKTATKLTQRYHDDQDVQYLKEMLNEMQDVTGSIQYSINEIRKVPVKTIFKPYQRLVRDLSQKFEKKIQFDLSGEELMIDSRLAKLLNNTLIHLVRNSLDHGIESPDIRLEAGKEEEGVLELKFEEKNDLIFIDIVDDGAGMSRDKIIEKAIEKNLYSQSELEDFSDEQVFKIIFDSGFSTSQEVTDVSGRGVGMDMVRSSVTERGGDISIQSVEGAGTRFSIKIPVPKSVFIINSLLVTCADQKIVVPVDDIREVVSLSEGGENHRSKLVNAHESTLLKHQDHHYHVINFADVMSEKKHEVRANKFLLLKNNDFDFAITVDHICDFEEVVVRKIDNRIQGRELFKGIAMLGEGEIAPVLCPSYLASQFSLNQSINIERDRPIEESKHALEDEYIFFSMPSIEHGAILLKNIYRLEKFNKENLCSAGDLQIVKYLNHSMPIVAPDFYLGLTQENLLEKDKEEYFVIVLKSQDFYLGLVVDSIESIGTAASDIHDITAQSEGVLGSVDHEGHYALVINAHFFIDQFKNIQNSQQEDVSFKDAA